VYIAKPLFSLFISPCHTRKKELIFGSAWNSRLLLDGDRIPDLLAQP